MRLGLMAMAVVAVASANARSAKFMVPGWPFWNEISTVSTMQPVNRR
jgi:hypothetical protein